MATRKSKPDMKVTNSRSGSRPPAPPQAPASVWGESDAGKPSQRDALQALLAFSALHDQVRRRKALTTRQSSFHAPAAGDEFEPMELFILDEALQLVAERALAITGADGLAIALAQNNEIVLRAAAGTVRPDPGTRIDRDSAFSGACLRTAQVINCDNTETDWRVNVEACRRMGVRSMVAVPLCGRHRVIGILEAFSSWPFAFNENDVRNLTLLAELILGALKPEDDDRFPQSAESAATGLDARNPAPPRTEAKPVAVVPATHALPPQPKRKPPSPVQPAVPARVTVRPQTAPVAPYATSIEPAARAPAPKPVLAAAPIPVAAPAPNGAPRRPVEGRTATTSAAYLAARAPSAPKVAPTFGQVDEERSQPPWLIYMLVGLVIASAFAAGVGWKLKTAQMGNQRKQNQAALQGNQTTGDEKSAESEADFSSDAVPDSNQPENTPANPQELSKFPQVTGLRHWSSGDSSTVVLELEEQVQYEPGHLSNPERCYFDLRDTQLVPGLQDKVFDGDTLLSHIRVAQPVAGLTRVVLEAKNNGTLSAPQVSLERDPYRLVIQVSKMGATPRAAASLFPNPRGAERAIVVPPPTKQDLQLRAKLPKMRIVVDAGHGGWDLGTVGRRGLLEKDLVLEISERLGKLLESRLGAEVIYTRQDDDYIALDQRAIMANAAHADLLISVHANYSDTPKARGIETYYTDLFSAPGTQDPSNSAGPKESGMRSAGAKNLPIVTLTPAELRDRAEQSRRLALSVQHSLYGALSIHNPGLRDRGIKEAGFVVLTESAMPGILAEVSFVSSPTDERKLRSDGYREQIAEAVYQGVARYASSSKGVKMASATK